MPQPPTIADMHHELLGFELVCRFNTCRHSLVLPVDAFAAEETVITISRRARCTKCGAKSANVYPLRKKVAGAGLPI